MQVRRRSHDTSNSKLRNFDPLDEEEGVGAVSSLEGGEGDGGGGGGEGAWAEVDLEGRYTQPSEPIL